MIPSLVALSPHDLIADSNGQPIKGDYVSTVARGWTILWPIPFAALYHGVYFSHREGKGCFIKGGCTRAKYTWNHFKPLFHRRYGMCRNPPKSSPSRGRDIVGRFRHISMVVCLFVAWVSIISVSQSSLVALCISLSRSRAINAYLILWLLDFIWVLSSNAMCSQRD